MGIFDKPNKQTDYESNITTIAAGADIRGELNVQCELHVEGAVNGDIISTTVVRIAESGTVTGTVKAKGLTVSGQMEGNIECDSVEILAGGEVRGNIYTDSLCIDFESVFEGQSIRRSKAKNNTESEKSKQAANFNTNDSQPVKKVVTAA